MTAPTTIPLHTEEHSPTPWDLVPGDEYHGAYITTDFGTTICDLYAMSNPDSFSVRNGGNSKPVPFIDMEANAAFIVRAVNERDALVAALKWALPLAEIAMEDHRSHRCQAGHGDTIQGTYSNGVTWAGIYQGEVDEIELARAVLAKAVKS